MQIVSFVMWNSPAMHGLRHHDNAIFENDNAIFENDNNILTFSKTILISTEHTKKNYKVQNYNWQIVKLLNGCYDPVSAPNRPGAHIPGTLDSSQSERAPRESPGLRSGGKGGPQPSRGPRGKGTPHTA